MEFIKTTIPGVVIIEPKLFPDARGYFMETYKQQAFEENIGRIDWVQENESKSSKGVLRGLHMQQGEHSQSKLVRVIVGEVYDVAVDVRPDSPTYGKYVGVLLSAENHKQFFIPKGFAHGFLVLSDECIFQYKVDSVYNKESETGFHYESFGVKWPKIDCPLNISDKDHLWKKLQ